MKRFRTIFYLLLLILFFAGLYTGLRIFFILSLSAFLLILTVFLLNVYTFYTFKFSQTISQEICETGDVPDLHLSLFNENFFPLSILVIHIQLVSLANPVDLTFSLPPFSSKSFKIPIDLPTCGTYRIGMSTMRIFDVFDLVPIRFDMHSLPYYRLKQLVVLPRAYPIDAIPGEAADAKSFTQARQQLAVHGDSYADTRLYRPGDPIKRMHWKKSAQHQTLYVRQYDLPEMEAITLIIDTSVLPDTTQGFRLHVHTLCECAATIALRALQRRKAVRLLFSDSEDELLCNRVNELDVIRTALATKPFADQPEHFLPFIQSQIPQITFDQEIYLLTGQTSTELMSGIEDYARGLNNLLLIQIDGHPSNGLFRTICVPKGGDVAASLTAGTT